jgi:hypothetical protein
MGVPSKELSQELLVKKIENSASSIKPRAEAQPGRPPHAQPKQGFSPEEQMSLKLVVQPENLIKSPASRRKPVIDAKSQAAKREVLVNIRRETGNGMNVLARVEKLHPGDPHRQVPPESELLSHPIFSG